MEKGTLTRMFQASVRDHGPKAALKYKRDGVWHTITYDGYGRYVRDFANGLMAIGIEPGDRVGIWSENRPEWSIADFGTMHTGALTAPIYPTLTPEQSEYIVNDAEMKVLIVQDAEKVSEAVEMLGRVDSLTHIVSMDPLPSEYDGKDEVLGFDDLYTKGRAYAEEHPDAFHERWTGVKPDDLATFIYTSGTTGNPKGVMLTHNNLYSNAISACSVLEIGKGDVHLSFLPLSHSFERTAGHIVMVYAGVTVAFAEGIDQLMDNLQEVKPTVVLSVPRLYEKMYTGVMSKVEQATGTKKKMFDWALGVGMKRAEAAEQGEEPPMGVKLQHPLADKLVLSKLRAALTGGRTRVMVTGAAALNPEVEKFFDAVGLHILQGYGQTEASPVITVNRIDDYRYGALGLPIPGVEVKLDAEGLDVPEGEGEILARGPNIMVGYHNLPDETERAITEDGWLRTGDVGRVDEDGFYYMTDRVKELFKTAYGKYIAPQPLENALKQHSLVGTPIILGEEKKFAATLIVPDFEALEAWAKKEGIEYADHAELCRNEKVRAEFQRIVDESNEEFANYEKLKAFDLIDRELTIENGELTPTLKVKRRVIMENFEDQIAGLWPE